MTISGEQKQGRPSQGGERQGADKDHITRLTLAEWKAVMKRMLMPARSRHTSARTVVAWQSRGGTDTGGQAADKDAGGRMQQLEPTGEDGAPTGLFSFERQNHGLAGRVQ